MHCLIPAQMILERLNCLDLLDEEMKRLADLQKQREIAGTSEPPENQKDAESTKDTRKSNDRTPGIIQTHGNREKPSKDRLEQGSPAAFDEQKNKKTDVNEIEIDRRAKQSKKKDESSDSNELHITNISLTDILDSSLDETQTNVRVESLERPNIGCSLGDISDSQRSIGLNSFNVLPNNASTPMAKAGKGATVGRKHLHNDHHAIQELEHDTVGTKVPENDAKVGNLEDMMNEEDMGKVARERKYQTQIQKTIENRLTQMKTKDLKEMPSDVIDTDDELNELDDNNKMKAKLICVKQKKSKVIGESCSGSLKVKKALKEIKTKAAERQSCLREVADMDVDVVDETTDSKKLEERTTAKKRKERHIVSDSNSDEERVTSKKKKTVKKSLTKAVTMCTDSERTSTRKEVKATTTESGVSKKTLSKLEKFKFDESKSSLSNSTFLSNTSISESMLSGSMWADEKADVSNDIKAKDDSHNSKTTGTYVDTISGNESEIKVSNGATRTTGENVHSKTKETFSDKIDNGKLITQNSIVPSGSNSDKSILGKSVHRGGSPAWLLKLNQKLASPNNLSQKVESTQKSPIETNFNRTLRDNKLSSTMRNATSQSDSGRTTLGNCLDMIKAPKVATGMGALVKNATKTNVLKKETNAMTKNVSPIFTITDDLDDELDDVDFSAKF